MVDSFLSSFDFLRYSKMISDFKVKNRSPPLKKKYQQLGIYQMHWHIASQVSKALYHESKSPYSGQASHRPWAYPWRHYLTFWQEGAFTIWAEGLSHWDDMIPSFGFEKLLVKRKEIGLGRKLYSSTMIKKSGLRAASSKKLFYSAALSVKLPSPHYLLTTRLAS